MHQHLVRKCLIRIYTFCYLVSLKRYNNFYIKKYIHYIRKDTKNYAKALNKYSTTKVKNSWGIAVQNQDEACDGSDLRKKGKIK